MKREYRKTKHVDRDEKQPEQSNFETELCLHSETIYQNSKQSLDSAFTEVWHKKEIGNMKMTKRGIIVLAIGGILQSALGQSTNGPIIKIVHCHPIGVKKRG